MFPGARGLSSRAVNGRCADKIAKIHDRSQRLDARREMMQKYSDLLDNLSCGAERSST